MARTKQKIKISDFYHIDEELIKDIQWIMIYGKRANGKSYAVKKYVLEHALDSLINGDNTEKFFYVRRYEDDVSAFNVSRYLHDFEYNKKTKKHPLEETTKGRFNKFKVAKKQIFVMNVDDDGNETDIQPIGYYINIGNAERMKSTDFTDVANIVFEEFIASTKPYLPSEPTKFGSLVSTIARNDLVKIFMVGNNDNRDCVYFRYYGLDRVKKQKPGTKDIYEKIEYDEGEPYKVKYLVDFAEGNVKGSKMFFGMDAKINNTGEWLSETQPKMTQEDLTKYDMVYEIIVEYHDLKYKCEFYNDPKTGGYFWYVRPKTHPIKKNSRVISDMISINPSYTATLSPLNKGEARAFKYLENGKIFFSDDLTGTEFKRAILSFTGTPLAQEYK